MKVDEMGGLGAVGEFERIRAFLRGAPPLPGSVVVGPGDDAAVLADGTVLSTDLAIEGVHFRLDWITAEEAGYRSAASAVSDLAAMAADPIGVLVSVAAPGDGELAEQAMAGVKRLAADVGAALLGGDLTRSPGPLLLDVVSVGRTDRALLRSGAAAGDELWVTGALGAAAAAVALWNSGRAVPVPLRDAFARPRPRLREARWLVNAGATSGIDVSDGIAGDAAHIAAASGVAVVLERDALPVHTALHDVALPEGRDAITLALHGGDDYEILVGAPAGRLGLRAQEFARTFGVPLTRVGRVESGEGAFLETARPPAIVPLARGGFDHFAAGVRGASGAAERGSA
jgi:thiamine-monophosphate kinase